ncbi:putative EF-hand calcium-binding domain-containing protein 11-like [Apostichopus japonicus]|uniref:Putative EF-hand calcium-binding domain-containing protein 11-like n=1 Tax=Stichopus japonicus TaxID=307972 RepID=A0A2G8KVS6_STIJA|nr:putative EF-hand calcium-binding domain-containing protein 11-like [Apostichopus japonicus]
MDLKVAMVSLFGYKPCKYEVDDLMGSAKLGLSKNVFIAAMAQKLAALDKDEEIRETFRAFDRHSKGFLTLDDLEQAASKVSTGFPKQRLLLAFQEMDGDKDGRISFRDFEFMMKYDEDDDL